MASGADLRRQLQSYLSAGLPRVSIVAICEGSKHLDGLELDTSEALERMLLPHEGCEPDCACTYIPVLFE